MVKRPRMSSPKPLSELLQDGLKGIVLGERLREADIWRLWPEVVGSAIAVRAEPIRIINGTLTIAVSSGPWMQELTFLKKMLKAKLNDSLGGEVVKEIVLKSGNVSKTATTDNDENTPLPPKKLTARQLALITEQSSAIPDDETRKAFTDLMKASLENSRNRSSHDR